MIRYISQKEVDLAARSPRIRHPPVPPQDSPTTLAFRQLKRDNAHRAMLEGRLSALQIQQERSDFREMQNQQRLRFQQLMRQQQQEQRERKQQYRERRQAQLQREQQLARQERETHETNLRKALIELSSSRTGGRQKKQAIERELLQLRLEDEENKQQRRREIREYEQQQRENMKEYARLRRAELQGRESEQVGLISGVREERAREIEQLGQLELLMVEKQARSRLSQQNSSARLQHLLKESTTLPTIPRHKVSPYSQLF